MKEAAGEANMTVITIVLIGLVAAAGAILIPNLLKSMKMRSACSELGGTLSGSTCTVKGESGAQGTYTCTVNESGEGECK